MNAAAHLPLICRQVVDLFTSGTSSVNLMKKEKGDVRDSYSVLMCTVLELFGTVFMFKLLHSPSNFSCFFVHVQLAPSFQLI
jgi:hypothetical protein